MNWTLIAISIVVAALRIVGVRHDAYQAAAHLLVGGLVGAAAVQYRGLQQHWWIRDVQYWAEIRDMRLKIALLIALSVVEVGCFLWFKFAT